MTLAFSACDVDATLETDYGFITVCRKGDAESSPFLVRVEYVGTNTSN